MSYDPVVDEVRAIRDAYARRFHYDLDAICRDLKKMETTCGHRVVSFAGKEQGLKPTVRSREGAGVPAGR